MKTLVGLVALLAGGTGYVVYATAPDDAPIAPARQLPPPAGAPVAPVPPGHPTHADHYVDPSGVHWLHIPNIRLERYFYFTDGQWFELKTDGSKTPVPAPY